jgi:hypothetical protein
MAYPELSKELFDWILQHITQLPASLEQGNSVCFFHLGWPFAGRIEDLLCKRHFVFEQVVVRVSEGHC